MSCAQTAVAALAILVAAGCRPRPRPAPGPAARAHGAIAYDVALDTPQRLEVAVTGARGASAFDVTATGAATTQSLCGPDGALVLVTAPGSLRGVIAGRPLDLTAAADRDALVSLLALDVDFAVQGSSLIYGATSYTQCAVQCERAVRCAALAPTATCAAAIIDCGGCLEQEP